MIEIIRPQHYDRVSLMHTSPELAVPILSRVMDAFPIAIVMQTPMHEVDPEVDPSVIDLDIFVPNSRAHPFVLMNCRRIITGLDDLPIDWDGNFEQFSHEDVCDYIASARKYLKSAVFKVTPYAITLLESIDISAGASSLSPHGEA
jgi:hypothetical protein